jgi:hypothetical protein
MFNSENMMDELGLSKEDKERIIKEVKEEFPNDEMLFELHLLRVVQYLKEQQNSS